MFPHLAKEAFLLFPAPSAAQQPPANEISIRLYLGSHSKMGLMTLPWGPKILTAADQGTLGFSKRETRKLKKTVEERSQAASSAQLRGQPTLGHPEIDRIR